MKLAGSPDEAASNEELAKKSIKTRKEVILDIRKNFFAKGSNEF
jgi:hypothetical protein